MSTGAFAFGFDFEEGGAGSDDFGVTDLRIGDDNNKETAPVDESISNNHVGVTLHDLEVACPVHNDDEYDNYLIPFGEIFYGEICCSKDAVKLAPKPITFDYEGDVEGDGQLEEDINYDDSEYKNNKLFKCLRSNEQIETGLDKVADIIIGLYEGGYKVWECSIDLVEYITTNADVSKLLGGDAKNSHNPVNVLELGCGHGFPGIICLKNKNVSVVFSDLNREVIDEITWPNILLNCKYLFEYSDYEQSIRDRVKCFYGDWGELSSGLYSSKTEDSGIPTTARFSLLLSAETLYNEKVCAKLFHMILLHLEVGGSAIISSKRYYFGVGGGTRDLMIMVNAHNSSVRKRATQNANECESRELICDVVSVFEDGRSNIREILLIKWAE